MERMQIGYVPPGIFYGQFTHDYPYPPVVTLIDYTGVEISISEIKHFPGAVEVYLYTSTNHNGLTVWA